MTAHDCLLDVHIVQFDDDGDDQGEISGICDEFAFEEGQTPEEDAENVANVQALNLNAESINDETILQTLQAMDQEHLKFQYVDFLKDFGRSEQILLDGDALITNALSNLCLDWRNGGQFLHVVFIVERFLESLWSRGAQLQIFFLMGNDKIFEILGASHCLCRKAILGHFQRSESFVRLQLKVHLIQGSWLTGKTDEWAQLIAQVRPAFIMSNNECSLHKHISIIQRWFVLDILLSGSYVVVYDGMKMVGSRVKAFLFSPPFPFKASKIRECMAILQLKVFALPECENLPPAVSIGRFEESQASNDFPFSDTRSCVYISSLRLILRLGNEQTKGFAAVCCVCTEVMRQLPLTARAFVLPGDDTRVDACTACALSEDLRIEVADFVDKFHAALMVCIDYAVDHGEIFDETVVDIFDGRLFHMLVLQSIAGYIPPENLLTPAMQLFATACPEGSMDYSSAISLLGSSVADVQAARLALDRVRRTRRDFASPQSTSARLRRIGENESLLTTVLGDVRSVMMRFETDDELGDLPFNRFRQHHYHSSKPLKDEPDSFKYDLELRKFDSGAAKTLKQIHKAKNRKALADFKFQESLLWGTPVKLQVIATKLSATDLSDLKKKAEAALSAVSTHPANYSKGKTIYDKLVTDKTVDQAVRRLKTRAMEAGGGEVVRRFKSMTTLDASRLDVFFDKAEEMGETCTKKDTLQLRMHCLRCYAELLVGSDGEIYRPSIRRVAFLTAQRILRHNQEGLDSNKKCEMGEILADMGFEDLADMLVGKLHSSAGQSMTSSESSPSIRFQIEMIPEHLERQAGIEKDPRVSFHPDQWQKTLLDVVDSGNSALVVAPTASGKTFISYYVMEQCLRVDDESVVVYVAPTKPLVNQVRAEISARFRKRYKGSQKMVSVFTRDFRDEDMLKAQILVTVPACLAILMLTGSNSKWTSRIRHIIFDEVHCIGDEGGEEWEQLILLCECPFLALSATLGNANHFHNWLKRVEEAKGRKIYKVEHNERYNDLCPWVWCKTLGDNGDILELNPCWVLQKVKGSARLTMELFPKDLKFLPENCAALYDAIVPLMLEEGRVQDAADISPGIFFPRRWPEALWNLSMRHVTEWEIRLKEEFCKLGNEAQDRIIRDLSNKTELCFADNDRRLGEFGQHSIVKEDITALMATLQRRGMLPALCFRLNRIGCERLAETLCNHFLATEQEWRTRPEKCWEEKRERLDRQLREARESLKRYEDRRGSVNSQLESEESSRLKSVVGNLEHMLCVHTLPRPESTVNNVPQATIEEAFGSLPYGKSWTDYVRGPLQEALRRGIAVHHSGLPLKYRQAVERMFRSKKIGVVFATGTLAMGINMPAKTSVFVTDAVYLIRQMAGRAGRRGFDLRGHTVFMAIQVCKSYF